MLVAAVDGTRDEIIRTEEISIRGTHNLYNAMAATLVGRLSGVKPASIRATLRNFKGVEHRLEFVREVNGVRYYNDSKATNVDSVWYALKAFREPIVLLLGGRDKGNDYTPLHDLVREHVKAIVAVGESAGIVEASFKGMAPISTATSMDQAVSMARSIAIRGDVVLLSPACASFDWFQNYEHRGRVFKEFVNAL
jgi:UDP-N-acetylmuramoylalanine--D-glutamate ligase